ncbi:hypothetical protein EV363DRAFT_1080651, partial [Boletus edulis]
MPVSYHQYCEYRLSFDDIASEHFHSSHLGLLLLTKAIIVFMAGEHPGAISRLDDLIATTRSNSLCYTVQARARHATTRRISQLTSSLGVHVSSSWKLADGT